MTDNDATSDRTTAQCQSPSDGNPHQPERDADAEQRELWRRYLQQQARRSCPGCGESGDAML